LSIEQNELNTGRRRWGLVALAVFAIAVRAAAVFAVGSYKLDHVTYEHGEIARNLVEGRGFVVRWMGAEGPTSQQAPVYPTFVAAFYWLFGVQTTSAVLAIQLAQCVIGGLLAAGVVMLASILMPNRPGAAWQSGIGVAVYPTLVYSATHVQVASLATTLLVLVLWTAARAGQSRSLFHATVCGLIGGLLVLTDPILGLVVLVAFGVIWTENSVSKQESTRSSSDVPATRYSEFRTQYSVRFRRLPFARVQLIAVVLAAFTAVTTPWIMRNYVVHGEFVFVKSTFGYAFWQGNHPQSFGTDKIPLPPSSDREATPSGGLRGLEQSLWRTRMIDTLYIDDAVLPNERIAELGRFSEPERSRQLMAEAMDYIRQHPSHYLRLCLQRLRFFLWFDETNPKSRVFVYRVSHLSLQLLAVAGLWLSRCHWRQLWPTYTVIALATLFHTLTIVSARFHIPLEPLQIVWAACGISLLGEHLISHISSFKTQISNPEPHHSDSLASAPTGV